GQPPRAGLRQARHHQPGRAARPAVAPGERGLLASALPRILDIWCRSGSTLCPRSRLDDARPDVQVVGDDDRGDVLHAAGEVTREVRWVAQAGHQFEADRIADVLEDLLAVA